MPSVDERTSLLPSKPPAAAHHNLAGLTPTRFRLTCLALWLTSTLVSLDGTLVATLLTPIGSAFNASNQASWLGTGYLLSLCCFTPVYGRLSDALGRRGAWLIASFFFVAGTVWCGLAGGMGQLIAARVVAGMGGGGLQTVGVIIMTDLVDLRHRGLFQGYANIFFGIGGGLGGPLGGFISDRFGWRTAFYIQVPFLVLTILLFYYLVRIPSHLDPSSAPPSSTSAIPKAPPAWRQAIRQIDYLGSLTLVLSVGSLLLSISLKTSSVTPAGEEYSWTHPHILGLLVTSLVSTLLFLVVESRFAVRPILPLRLLTRSTPALIATSSLVMVTNQFSVLYNIPLFFSTVLLAPSSTAGAHLIPYTLLIGVGSLSVGYIMRRTGKYYWVTVISAGLMVVSSVLLNRWKRDVAQWETWTAQMPGGFGYAGVLTSSLVALMTDVQREGKGETAVATSMTYMFRTIGQVLGVSLSAAIVQAVVARDLPKLITGPDAEQIIFTIRHSTSSIPTLPAAYRDAATQSYEHALHIVFMCNLVLAVVNLGVLSLMKEQEMPQGKKRLGPGEAAEEELSREQA